MQLRKFVSKKMLIFYALNTFQIMLMRMHQKIGMKMSAEGKIYSKQKFLNY